MAGGDDVAAARDAQRQAEVLGEVVQRAEREDAERHVAPISTSAAATALMVPSPPAATTASTAACGRGVLRGIQQLCRGGHGARRRRRRRSLNPVAQPLRLPGRVRGLAPGVGVHQEQSRRIT